MWPFTAVQVLDWWRIYVRLTYSWNRVLENGFKRIQCTLLCWLCRTQDMTVSVCGQGVSRWWWWKWCACNGFYNVIQSLWLFVIITVIGCSLSLLLLYVSLIHFNSCCSFFLSQFWVLFCPSPPPTPPSPPPPPPWDFVWMTCSLWIHCTVMIYIYVYYIYKHAPYIASQTKKSFASLLIEIPVNKFYYSLRSYFTVCIGKHIYILYIWKLIQFLNTPRFYWQNSWHTF